MNLILRRSCPASDAAVEALFAANLTAHARAGQAADDVARSSDRNRLRLEGVRAEIAERTSADRRTRPQPHTSDVRQLVEDALSRPGLRGLPIDREPT